MGQMLFMPGVMLPSEPLIGNSQLSQKVNGRMISNKPRQLTPDGKQEMVVEYVEVPKQQPIGNVSQAWDQAFQANNEVRDLDGSDIREYVQDRGAEGSGLTFQDIQQEFRSGARTLGIMNPNLQAPTLLQTLDKVNAPAAGPEGMVNNNQQPLGKPAWDAAYGCQPSQVASPVANAGQQPAPQPVANNSGQQPLGSMGGKWDQEFGQK